MLFDTDLRFAKPLALALGAESDLIVGENVPYSGELENDCMSQHGTKRGLAHALIEIRQDLIGTTAGQNDWARRLSHITSRILSDHDAAGRLHQISHNPRTIAEFDDIYK